MAAADYYATGPRPTQTQQSSFLAPPAPPQRASSHPAMTFPQMQPSYSHTPPFPSPQHRASQPQYPQRPPPPAYPDEHRPSVHFGPTLAPLVQEPQQRHSFSHEQRPNPQTWNQPPYQQPSISNPQSGPYAPPQRFQYPQHPPHPVPHMRPYMNPNPSEASVGSGYSSDPEPHRRRHRHKDRKRRISENSRSTTADGFLGAAGGTIIGDLIFPGLGTVGGALAGWFGGKDYGNHRKWREEKREREEEEWQRKYSRDHGGQEYGHDSHHDRSHSHSSDGRRKSSHDGRRSDH